MAPQDRKRLAHCLIACSELYGKPVSEALAGIWWNALRAYDIEAVETAFQRHMTNPDTGQFMPKPADIVRMLAGTTQDAALTAWAKVDRAVRTVGPYASVTFDDALTMRVVQDMGGWIAFGTKTDDEWPFIGNEFVKRYQGYRQRGEAPDYPTRLLGIHEHDNTQKGYKPGEVVLIGDPQKARAVADGGSTKPALGVQRVPIDSISAKVLKLVDGTRQ